MTPMSAGRLASIQEIALSYKGVPQAVRRFSWLLVHRTRIEDEHAARVAVPAAISVLGGGYEPQPRGDVAVVDVHPGQPDRHAGWRFRFGFHSRARVAVLFLEE